MWFLGEYGMYYWVHSWGHRYGAFYSMYMSRRIQTGGNEISRSLAAKSGCGELSANLIGVSIRA